MIRALLLLLTLATSAAGQIWPVEAEAKPPHLVIVRAGSSAGSGVCVWSNEKDKSYIATCWHVVQENPSRVSANGIRGKTVAQDQRADVALLEIPAKFFPVRIRAPIVLEEKDKLWPTRFATVRIGETVVSEGFPGMRYAVRQGPVIGNIGDSFEARFVSLPGHSGGPAFVDNQLCGLVWGGPSFYNHAAITPARHIQRLLSRVLAPKLF